MEAQRILLQFGTLRHSRTCVQRLFFQCDQYYGMKFYNKLDWPKHNYHVYFKLYTDFETSALHDHDFTMVLNIAKCFTTLYAIL